jgi:hypothetical protein
VLAMHPFPATPCRAAAAKLHNLLLGKLHTQQWFNHSAAEYITVVGMQEMPPDANGSSRW